jgi:hypothetical protein
LYASEFRDRCINENPVSRNPKGHHAVTDQIISAATQLKGAVLKGLDVWKNTKEQVEDATSDSAGRREDLFIVLAGVSHQTAASTAEIETAVKDAIGIFVERYNSLKPISLGPFATEMKRAMHPKVRAHVRDLVQLARDAWASESDKTAKDRVVRKMWSRQYQLLVNANGLLGQMAEGNDLMTVAQVTQYANDTLAARALDPERAVALVATMIKQLQAIHASFPHGDVLNTISDAQRITVAELRRVAARKGAPVTPVTPVEVRKPNAAPTLEAINNEADVLDDAA